ncbi:hypothetical protein [Bacillus sp. JCM 19034]|uniref:hypothetical protein n=1 Tax=Bacillus sp. JCM 19034 TaxID=1481928 RepID=UPI000A49DBA6
MQALYDQIQVYLNMEEEITFKEFQSYYQQVLNALDEQGDSLDEEMIWKSLFIVENVMTNAEGRANAKAPEAKKYKKMAQRLQLWAKNLAQRLGILDIVKKILANALIAC